MAKFRISSFAEQALQEILAWIQQHFGEQGRLRYEALLVQAILDVAAEPKRAGSRARPELALGACTYHLRFSRDRIRPPANRVHKPRHLLLYRLAAGGVLEIGRVLHDSMDLARHLPPDYQTTTGDTGN